MDDELPRYGLQWNGPEMPVSALMPDGYWTPWHVAQERIERLQRELAESAQRIELLEKNLDDDELLTICDCCGALHDDCVEVGAGDAMQCPSCCRIAALDAELDEARAELDKARVAVFSHVADLEQTAIKLGEMPGFEPTVRQFRLAANELRDALGGEGSWAGL